MMEFLSLFEKFGAWALLVAFLVGTNWLRERRMAARLDIYADRDARRAVQMARVVNANTRAAQANERSARSLHRLVRSRLPPQVGGTEPVDDDDDDEPQDLPQVDDDSDMHAVIQKREPRTSIWALIGLGVLVMLMGGCGSARAEQQNTVEQEVYEIGPMTMETPAGQVIIHKTGIVRKMSRYRTTTATQEYTFPEVREIGGALLGGVTGPLAGGGIVGLAMAWLMKRTATKNIAERAELEREAAEAEERHRQIARAMDAYAADIERADTDQQVADIKTKHAKRQQALGIADHMERARHA